MADELQRLRDENQFLRAKLAENGISWEYPPASPRVADAPPSAVTTLETAEKVALFRRLFRGRMDVYPRRWESPKGKTGYSPVCGNEWVPGVCFKPKVKCGECAHQKMSPVTDQVIHDHLSGKHTVGVYPMLPGDKCYFLAADLDEEDWRNDARALMETCRLQSIPAALEISRSGQGAHLWIFFSEPVPAREARRLGSALISQTCERVRQLSLSSYDRFFPNQDKMPKGGFGNLIALPLQKMLREQGRSVFVDQDLKPYPDQWAFLGWLQSLSRDDLENAILRTSPGRHSLDVAFLSDDDESDRPWMAAPVAQKLTGPMPESLTLVVANQIFVAKSELPQGLSNRLIRLAAFQNPEFHKNQAMRLSVWNIPRIIGCAENFPQHIGLPRGCLDGATQLLKDNGIRVEIQDERVQGTAVEVHFTGTLRNDQEAALRAILRHDHGVLSAPTAFGKTVLAAALIARRGVSTLILVHRTDLLRQWKERLTEFLTLSKESLGVIGGGKKKPSGQIDIAVLKSLSKREDLLGWLEAYGQVIVDECHHLSAVTHEGILKSVKSRYVTGLTATPVRRDGHHPIIFMQCGPIRHTAVLPKTAPTQLEVWPRYLPCPKIAPNCAIQEIFRILAHDATRNDAIIGDVLAAYKEGRKVLVLTGRTDHLTILREALEPDVEHCFALHGRMSQKQRQVVLAGLEKLGGDATRVLIATGSLIGEGFDHPPLDTLVLAQPVSWTGLLEQYAGRLHRGHVGKEDVRIYDYVESDHGQLNGMWIKRQRGYRKMGYKLHAEDALGTQAPKWVPKQLFFSDG